LITRRRFGGLAAGAFAGITGLGGYAFGFEPVIRLKTTRYVITPENWPRGLSLRIAVLTDIHVGGITMPISRVNDIVRHTNTLGADVIVILGDLVVQRSSRHSELSAECANALAALWAPLGVHAVLGNHDWWDDPVAQAAAAGPVVGATALRAAGIPVYENSGVRLEKAGRPFWLLGLADQLALKRRGQRFKGFDDLPATLRLATDDAPIILMAHEPDIFASMPTRVALTLSGHTHGGQVRLFGYSPIVPSKYDNRYAYGHVVENGIHLVVSGGLGTGRIPVRLGVPPEVVVVDIGSAEPALS
jgi:uncharacterized protein